MAGKSRPRASARGSWRFRTARPGADRLLERGLMRQITIAAVLVGSVVSLAPVARTQSTSGSRPEFEVVSVKPCGRNGPNAGGGGRGSGGGGGVTAGRGPGRLVLSCNTTVALIRLAYLQFPDG